MLRDSDLFLQDNRVCYGWNIRNDCDDYGWGRAHRPEMGGYQSEHVLEWEMVTMFLTTMNSHPEFVGNRFPHPDSIEGGALVSFCRYWAASWNRRARETMSIPDPSVTNDLAERTPLKWLATAYLGRKKDDVPVELFLDEMILLQTKVNALAKSNVS
jgi:hypothetical protein